MRRKEKNLNQGHQNKINDHFQFYDLRKDKPQNKILQRNKIVNFSKMTTIQCWLVYLKIIDVFLI